MGHKVTFGGDGFVFISIVIMVFMDVYIYQIHQILLKIYVLYCMSIINFPKCLILIL